MLKNLTIYQDLAWDQAPQWEKRQKKGEIGKMAVVWGEGTGCATPSHPQTTARQLFFLGARLSFSLSPPRAWSQTNEDYSGALMCTNCVQRRTMGKKMWLFICIQEILVLRKSLFHRRGEISHFKHPRVSAVNRMATPPTRTFRGKK